jgi:hypothetical protein
MVTGLTPSTIPVDPPKELEGFAKLAKPFSASSDTKRIAYSQPLKTIKESQYLEGLVADNDPYKLMAANQGFWDELGNSIVQSGANLIFDIGEGVGYLNPYEIYQDLINKDQEFGNSFSNWFAEKNKEVNNAFPIYSVPGERRWHEWFFENIPSVVSGLSLLIPAYGGIKLLSATGKALKGAQLAKAVGISTSSLEAAEIVGMAGLSRQMEGMMEGKELSDKMYQDGIDRGLGEDNAREIAAQAARKNYADNWNLLASDIVQFGMGLKLFGKASRMYKDSQKATKSLINNPYFALGTQMGLEGGEEIYQAVRQRENERQTLIDNNLIKDDYTSFKERLYDYVSDPDVQTAGIFGAIGGGVFQAGTSVLSKREEKERQKRDNIINNSLEQRKAVFQNDPIKFKQESDVTMYSLMLDAVETGRADQIEELFNATTEGKFNDLSQEEQQEVKANIEKYKQDLSYLEETFNNIKKDPTISNDVQLVSYSLRNRAAYRIQQITHNSLANRQQKEVLRLTEENNLNADRTKLLHEEVELNLLQNEILSSDIKDIEKSTIKSKIEAKKKEVNRLKDQIKTNENITDVTLDVNKSVLATLSVPKLLTELDLDQLNKQYNKLGTTKGIEDLKKQLNKEKEDKKQEVFNKLVSDLQNVNSLEEKEALKKVAKTLDKENEFNTEFEKTINKRREVAPAFNPANVKASLTDRYKNDKLLGEYEINQLENKLLFNGGIPESDSLEDAIEERYKGNPEFKKVVDDFFKLPIKISTKDTTTSNKDQKDSSKDTIENLQKAKDLTKSNLNTVWQLKGLQMKYENNEFVKDSNGELIPLTDNLAKKIGWWALNTGKIKTNDKVYFEYDTDEVFNINNSDFSKVLFESVVYLDKNTSNKSKTNRVVIGALPAFNEKNKTFTLEENQQLKELRQQLFNEVTNSSNKTGIITLTPTTEVLRINEAKFWNIKDITRHEQPHKVLRPDEELIFGIAKYKKVGKEKHTFLFTNGHPIKDLMNPKALSPGMTYMSIQAPNGEYIPISTRVKPLGELPNEFKQVKDLILALKENPNNKEEILNKINELVFLPSVEYLGNDLLITKADEKTTNVQDLDKFLSELLMKIDESAINKGSYNLELSKGGWITTDINPIEHFHSTSVQLKPININKGKVTKPENKATVDNTPIKLESNQLDSTLEAKKADIERRIKHDKRLLQESIDAKEWSGKENTIGMWKASLFRAEKELRDLVEQEKDPLAKQKQTIRDNRTEELKEADKKYPFDGQKEERVKLKNEINAKYDAELATLENKFTKLKVQEPSIDIILGKDNIKYQVSDNNEFEILNEQEVRDWFAKKLPLIDLLFVDQLIEIANTEGAVAFGSYWNNLVTLYKNAPKTTPFHEAGHGVFERLPKNQQEQLLNDASTRYKLNRSKEILKENIDFTKESFQLGINSFTQKEDKFYKTEPINETRTEWKEVEITKEEYNISFDQFKKENPEKLTRDLTGPYNTNDLILEENIMDEFASYMMEQGLNEANLPLSFRSFFKKLLEFLKHIFSSNITKDQFFYRINQGFYANKKSTNNSNLRYSQAKLHPAVALERVKMINFYFFKELDAIAESHNLKNLSDIQILKKINTDPYLALTTVYSKVWSALDKAHANQPDGVVKTKLKQTLDNLLVVDEERNIVNVGDLYKLAVRELSQFGIKVKFTNEDITLEENETDYTENEDLNQPNEEENKKEQYDVNAIQKNQKDNIGFKVKKLLRTSPKYIKNNEGNFELAVNDIGFYQLVEFDDIYNTIQENLVNISSREEALTILNNLKEQKHELQGIIEKLEQDDVLLTQFISHFAQSENQFIQIFERVDSYRDNESGLITDNRKFVVSNANRRSSDKILADLWQNNLLNISRNNITNSDLSINKERANKYYSEYESIINNIQVSRNVTEVDAINLSKVLNNFGIEVSEKAILDQFTKSVIPFKNGTLQITPIQTFNNFTKELNSILNSLKAGQNPYEGETTSVLNVTKKLAKSMPNLHQSAILSSDGKTRYVYSLQTFLSKFVKDLKDSDYREDLAENWWFKYNTFLQELNNSENNELRDNFEFGVFEGLKYNYEDIGTNYINTTPYDLTISDINLFDNNGNKKYAYYRLPMMDSSLSPMVKFKKFTEQEVIDGLYQLALAEQERINLIDTIDIKIKHYNEKENNGKKFNFLEIFNTNGVSVSDEVAAKEAISEWLNQELIKERIRLTDLKIINEETGHFNKIVSSNRDTNTLLKDYLYNNILAKANLIQLTSVDLAFFKNYPLFIKRNGEVLKYTTFLDTQASYNGTFVGEYYNTVYLKDEIIKDIKLGEKVKSLLIKEGTSEKDADRIAAYYKDINQTDAQAYITVDRKRKIMIGLGQWNDQYEAAYKSIINNKANFNDISLMLQPIKPFFYGFEKTGDLIIPVQNKNSEVVLIPQFAKESKQLSKLLDLMNKDKVDSVQFNSTVKVGEHGAISFEELESGTEPYIHILENKYYGVQTEVPEKHIDTQILFGSQLRKLGISDIKDGTTFFDGKLSKDDIINIYNDLIEQNLIDSYTETKEIFDDIKKLQEVLIQSVRDLNLDYFHEEALQLTKDDLGNEQFTLPLFAPINSKRSQAMVNSLIRSRITKQKINGASLVLVSNFGLSDKLNIKFREDGNIDYMEVMLPQWTRNKYFKDKDITEIPEDLLELLGYRIPTEHKYSIKKLKVVGFTPDVMGGVALLPAAITKIAGEDFDIDKMYVMIPEFEEVDGNIQKIKYDFNSKELNRKQRNNAIIDILKEVWTSQSSEVLTPGNFDSLINYSKFVIERLQINENLNPILPSSNIEYFRSLTAGSALIGLGANQNSSHAVTQYTETSLETSIDFNGEKRQSLNTQNDINGRLISRNLAEYLSAFVDNLKDPVSGILNITTNTFPVIAAITRVGYSLQTSLDFVNQPVIRKLTELQQSTSYQESVKILENLIASKIDISDVNGKYNLSTKKLRDSITNTSLSQLTEDELRLQALVLSSYKIYKKLGDSLSNFVNATKFDSNGVGKNIAEIMNSLNRVDQVKKDKNIKTSIFDTKNISSTFLEYGVEKPINEFINKYFPYSNPAFTNLINELEQIKGDNLTERETEYLYTHAVAWYMSSFGAFNNSERKEFIEQFPDTFSSKRSLIKDYKFNKYIRFVGVTSDNKIPKLELYSNVTITKEQVRDIKLSWETMIMSNNPEISQLGKDLVKYAYFTTNLNYTFSGFSHLVPPNYLLSLKDNNDLSYSDNLYKLLSESNFEKLFDRFINDFVRNQHNNRMVPTLNLKDLKIQVRDKSTKILTSIATEKIYGDYIKVKDKGVLRTYHKLGSTVDEKYNVYNIVQNKGYENIFEYDKVNYDSILKINELPVFPETSFINSIDTIEQEKYYQLEEKETQEGVKKNEELRQILFRFAASKGIKIEYIEDMYERTGRNAVGLADILNKTILVSKGKETINTLPEEIGHFAEAFSRGTVFHDALMNLVDKTKEYQEVSEKYKEINPSEDYLKKETIGQLIGKAIIKQQSQSTSNTILQYLRVVWKKFIDLFKSSNEVELNNEVQEIIGEIAKKVINNDTTFFNTTFKIKDTFYSLGNSRIITEQKVLKDAAESLYKKIKIYENRSLGSFTENEKLVLDKLVKDFNDKNYKEGIYNYVIKSIEELNKIGKRYSEINLEPETLDQANETLSYLKDINNYVQGFRNTLEEISELDVLNTFSPEMIKSTGEAVLLGKRLTNLYLEVGQPILKKVLKEFTTNDQLDLDSVLNKVDNDITWTQRWLDSLAETNSPLLSIMDVFTKHYKNNGRRKSIVTTKKIVESQKEMEKGGYLATSIVAERDFNGNPTGRYVTEYNLGEYYKQKENFFTSIGKRPENIKERKEWKKKVKKWYEENNQLHPNIEAFKKEKLEEFKREYKANVAQEKYNAWLEDNAEFAEIYDEQVGYQRVIVTYKNAFYIPSNKYKNSVYQMIHEKGNEHIKQYYDTITNTLKELDSQLPINNRLNGFLPQMRKDLFERLLFTDENGTKKLKGAKDIGRDTRVSISEAFVRNENDTDFGLTDEKGEPINFVPAYFTTKLKDMRDLSLDITSSTIALVAATNDFSSMSKIIDTLEYAKDTLGAAELVKKGFDPVTLFGDKVLTLKSGKNIKVKEIIDSGDKSLAYERLTDYINMIGYGKLKDIETIKIGSKIIDASKLADFVNTYTSLTSLALNIYSGISNITFGGVQTAMEAFAGEYYSLTDILKAEKIYAGELPNNITNIGRTLSKENTLDEWGIYMNVLQNYNKDFRDIDAARRNRVQRLMKTSSLYFINHAGEHWLQNSTSLALANRVKLRDDSGKVYTLWEAFKEFGTNLHTQKLFKVKGEKTTDLFKENEDGVRFTERDLNRFINRQNFINKRLHGIYNDMDKSAIQRKAIGRLAIMFRKFIKPGWNRRYEHLRYNEEGELWTEGYYKTFGRLFKNMFVEVQEGQASLIKNWNKLTPYERANMYRLMTEVAFLLMTIVLISALTQMADDDKDNYYLNLAAYEAYRLYSEMRFYTSITEIQRIIKSPAAAVYSMEKVNRFLSVWDWSDEIKRGKYKGYTKFEARILDLLPLSGTYFRFKSPEEQLKFFNDQGITIF